MALYHAHSNPSSLGSVNRVDHIASVRTDTRLKFHYKVQQHIFPKPQRIYDPHNAVAAQPWEITKKASLGVSQRVSA